MNFIKQHIFPILFAMVSFFILFLMIRANIDLSTARYMIFQDEILFFDQVYKLLYPESFEAFITTFAHNNDLRYGRASINLLAITSFIPEYFWGAKGQIIAIRMTQTLLVFTAYFALVFFFIKTNALRLLAFVIILCVPFTHYYMSMPKPEPLLLLTLAFFFYFYNKENFKVDKAIILLGFAFGLKISALPIVLLCLVISISLSNYKDINTYKNFFMYFFFGFSLAIPAFIPLVILFYLLDKIISKLINHGLAKFSNIINSLFLIIFIFFMETQNISKLWLKNTLLNTSQVRDSSNIDFFSWYEYFTTYYFSSSAIISNIFLILLVLLVFTFIPPFLKKGFYCENRLQYVILVSGIGLILSIWVSTQRLWGMYLYIGVVLMCIGIISLYDVVRQNQKSPQKILSALIILFLCIGCVQSWQSKAKKGMLGLAKRTESAQFIMQHSNYEEIINFLDSHEFVYNNNVVSGPWLFRIESTEKYSRKGYWPPFIAWEDQNEVLILELGWHKNREKEGNSWYQSAYKEEDGYKTYVIEGSQTCEREFCYRIVKKLENDTEILVLEKN